MVFLLQVVLLSNVLLSTKVPVPVCFENVLILNRKTCLGLFVYGVINNRHKTKGTVLIFMILCFNFNLLSWISYQTNVRQQYSTPSLPRRWACRVSNWEHTLSSRQVLSPIIVSQQKIYGGYSVSMLSGPRSRLCQHTKNRIFFCIYFLFFQIFICVILTRGEPVNFLLGNRYPD
jgi:hypothetical protein